MSDGDMKVKEEKYARPQNIEFLQAPKVNRLFGVIYHRLNSLMSNSKLSSVNF